MFSKKVLSMYSRTILVVDDVPLFLDMAKDFFRREQIEVLTATSGREALEIVGRKAPDLILLDLYMPGEDGDAVCRKIKDEYNLHSVPVVMMTSSDRPYDAQRCREAGCDDMIHKPLVREQVLSVCRKFVKLPSWSGRRIATGIDAAFGSDRDNLAPGVLSDIGVGGVFLETDRPLPQGSELHLEFRLTGDLAPIRCRGKVAWINSRAKLKNPDGAPGMGVEFVDIKRLDLLAIQAWLMEDSCAPNEALP
jgi:CheY-like chemotaxis protein